ncbi:MAG: NADH-quinone oxidoreductase subunit 5 family protein [Planctomycetota bacterium]|jgi:NADH-quinone oxidoreductase subunit L
MNHELIALVTVMAPLAGFAIALLGFRRKHGAASAIVVASGAVTAVGAGLLLFNGPVDGTVFASRWFEIGDHTVDFGVLLDGRTKIMGAVVALITLCIQVYSLSYMAHDSGKARFFAFLALFEWSMLLFVMASNLLQMFIFWELVGLASFLLIGFWYEKPSAVAAAKKAFIMTRIGDLGLMIGLILLLQTAGTLDVQAIIAMFSSEGLPPGVPAGRIELIATLLFIGVIGKSAQFPLHTWLPDAMEGPTPVSALLHSATMVAAGVFLVARFHELFMDAPGTMRFVLMTATFTALLSSTMAMVARDMKRVLAFSSISQLGFMLMGLAAGSLFAGFFHLTTHAFFKALLFLCAGAYIHQFGTNDMVAMGRAGASKSMRLTTIGLVVGGAALAGIPPLAGFFSKEQIIGSLSGSENLIFRIGAYGAAFLTAYYSFRMVFLILRPDADSAATEEEPAGAQHAGGHGHDHGPAEPWPIRLPIIVLSLGALGAGFLGDRIGHMLGLEHVHHPALLEMAPAIVIALLGVALAWLEFGRRGARQTGFIARVPALESLFVNRWYIDVVYRAVFVRLAVGIARLCFGVETRGFDGAADKLGEGTVAAGAGTARAHSGRLQFYIGTAVVLVAAIVFYLGRS